MSSRAGTDAAHGKGKGVDRGPPEQAVSANSSAGSLPITTAGNPRGGSHLRQMSNASSIGSSLADTPSGSYNEQGFLGPDGSHMQAGSRSDEGDAAHEPMFNFRSLAELVGVNIEDGSAHPDEAGESGESPSGRPLSQVKEEEFEAEHLEKDSLDMTGSGYTQRTITLSSPGTFSPEASTASNGEKADARLDGRPVMISPEVTLTPGTPVPDEDSTGGSKRLGYPSFPEQPHPIAQ